MNSNLIKNIGIYAAITVLFIILSYSFVPELLSGKVVNQSDIAGWQGMAQEAAQWNKSHPDDKALWTDSMFGGMPTVTVIDDFDGDWTKPMYKALLWGKRPASYLFIALLGAFLMMLSMGVNRFLAVAGAIAVAFCTYNFQIIQVGHNTKMQAIAFAPWVIASVIFTLRSSSKGFSRILLGTVLFALSLSFQVKANHVQITYYLAIVLLIYVISVFVSVIRAKEENGMKNFLVTSLLLLCGAAVGIGTNANKLIPTAGYAQYTMRGGSELKGDGVNSEGLSLDYATAWSYGINEMPNLMIPNYNGGSSNGSLDPDSEMGRLFKRAGQNPVQACKSLPLYWGPQPFTAGPMYLGAISIFLFVLGLFLLKSKEKWWLLVATVVAILLAWGSHMMWFTKIWFDYAPMYNKFRTVSMALSILQFTVPLLGIYTLDLIVKSEFEGRKVVKSIWWALGITGGFCMITALFPSIAGDFTASSDTGMPAPVLDALRSDRRHLLQSDAWRSFLLILTSAGIIMWSFFKSDMAVSRKRRVVAASVISVLILFDLWSVGKRYLNSSHFIKPRDFSAQLAIRPVDEEILKDKDPSYRVLDLSENTFNSSLTSLRHKSIGGYSPTKMQRYQDLIDRYLAEEIKTFYKAVSDASTIEEIQSSMPSMPIISMLNARYIIIGGEYPPVINENAFGSAWFVDNLQYTDSPDAEIATLKTVNLKETAVVCTNGCDNADHCCNSGNCGNSSVNGNIEMTVYTPNEVRYEFISDTPATAVFSEIYHPDWKATVTYTPEGEVTSKSVELPLLRANWILRAADIPAGKGEIVMRFCPAEYKTGEVISLSCSIIMLLSLIFSLLVVCYSSRTQRS